MKVTYQRKEYALFSHLLFPSCRLHTFRYVSMEITIFSLPSPLWSCRRSEIIWTFGRTTTSLWCRLNDPVSTVSEPSVWTTTIRRRQKVRLEEGGATERPHGIVTAIRLDPLTNYCQATNVGPPIVGWHPAQLRRPASRPRPFTQCLPLHPLWVATVPA